MMKKARMKRSLALLLAVVMCIGLLPMGALAARIVDDEIAIDAPSATEDADLAVLPEGSSDEAEEPSSLPDKGKAALAAARENVALSASVTMTGAVEYGRDDLKLPKINDGDLNSRLAIPAEDPSDETQPGQTADDVVFEFTLDGVKTIEEVVFYELANYRVSEFGRVEKLAVRVSKDGSAWQEVVSKANPNDASEKYDDDRRKVELTFDPVEADKVQVIATDADRTQPSIWEVEIYTAIPEEHKPSPVITGVTSTAGSTYPASEHIKAENITNGKGMSDDTVYATVTNNGTVGAHWHSDANPGANAWVQADLGAIYQLDEMYIWNMNQVNQASRGLKNVKIEYAVTEGEWTELAVPNGMSFGEETAAGYPFQFAKASGQDGQTATNLNDGSNTPVKFNGVEARYVRVTAAPTPAQGQWTGDGYYGLTELRFTGILPEEPATAGAWKLSTFGSDAEKEDNGWLTTKTADSFVLDYGALYTANNNVGNVVVYDSGAADLEDTILEFDYKLEADDAKIQFGIFPRFQSGRNCDGMAIGETAQIQHSFQVNGSEGWPDASNLSNMTFVKDKVYHFKVVTVGNTLTAYVDGVKLTEFTTNASITHGGYGFRIWGQPNGGKKIITVSNLTRKEYVPSTVDKASEVILENNWGSADVTIPITLGSGDSVESTSNGTNELVLNTDYTVAENSITLKQSYILAQQDSFTLNISFAGGSEGSFQVVKYSTVVTEYVWTPEKGTTEWQNLSGNGTFAMAENVAVGEDINNKSYGSGMRITGAVALVNTNSPACMDGEVELTYAQLNDDGNAGVLFRADTNENTWQGVWQDTGYMQRFYFKNSANTQANVHGDCSYAYARMGYADHKLKIRVQGNAVTIWMDDQFVSSTNVSAADASALGKLGIYTGSSCDILLKKAVFRNVLPFVPEVDNSGDKTITNDGMTVRLADNFPRVKDYTLNGKKLSGTEFKYDYVTINTVDYPATATVKAEAADSITYTVTPDGCDVTFDVKFTVLPNHVLEMLIQNIDETNVKVNSIGFPNQPLISANSTQTGAKLDATAFEENMFTGGQWDQTTLVDRHYVVAENKVSKGASESATIAVVTNNDLSASMANNVLYNIHEFQLKAFDLPQGGVSAGVMNTEFVHRGLDGEKMFPIASEPEENDLYCRVAVAEDTNGDDVLDWQDGANALKTIISDKIPGGDNAARSHFHVGYNFVSEAQQPFLKVADNMKRLSNMIDGFGQILVLKGYANEGHDSGHSDYDDVNRRAGGAEDMQTAASEVKNINSLLGIHINNSECYPEAKMFNLENMTAKDAWTWMDQSKSLRREVYILNGGMDKNLDSLFSKVPDLGFVYVDTYGDDRWSSSRLADNLVGNGAMMGTENKTDLDRYVSWVHWPEISANSIHHFVYHTQKDVYQGSGNYFGGYTRSSSMMSWQHQNDIGTQVSTFYTNQLPQKYLMCHDVLRQDGQGNAYFEGGIRTNNYQMWKDEGDGEKLMVGNGGYFIPWYAEDSETRDPDEAAKIYYWTTATGEKTWDLPKSWNNVTSVYLYKNTQTGKVLVDTLTVNDHQVTINGTANTPYVVYPAEQAQDTTEWSVGSPIKDTGFNSRDFSIWQKDGEANIAFNDDGNGVSILTISGTQAGQISQTMTGLTVGQRYRVVVWMGAENGKTARLTVKQDDAVYENYVEQTVRGNNHFDTYASGKWVDRVHVDFTATAATAEVILSADACEAENGKATFMESRILKTADPGAPTDVPAKKYAAYETFEYVEEGGTGIFTPEGGGDGGYHLSETHLPYTSDTIPTGVKEGEVSNWSLKMYGYGRATMRTYPASMRLLPNMEYTMEFDTLGGGTVQIMSEADNSDKPLEKTFTEGHSTFTFTTGSKTDYIARISGCNVLDNFQVYFIADLTPPTAPANVQATVDGHPYVTLTWEAATDSDSGISSYKIFRDGERIATVTGTELTYTDRTVRENTTYRYQISAVNGGTTEGSKSDAITVEVGGDALPPELVSATLNDLTTATVVFNEKLDVESAETTANYHLADTEAVVTAAKLQDDGKTVVLTLEGFGSTDAAALTVTGVKDVSGNAIDETQPATLTVLVRYYKFDETEGTAAIDATGNENGTKSSAVGVTEGKKDKAAQFNADGYVEVPTGSAFYHQDEFTVSAWINWGGVTGESQTILSNGASGDPNAYGIWFHIRNDSKLWCSFKNNNGGYTDMNSGNVSVPENQWVHVAFVKRADGHDLYLNGEQVATNSVAVDWGDHNGKLRIGGNYNTGNSLLHKFKGGIDDFKIFNAPLTEDDIIDIAGEGKPPVVVDNTLNVIRGMEADTTLKVYTYGAGIASITDEEGAALDAADYTVIRNGLILTGAYLKTLALGEHTLTVTFDDEASTTGTITVTVEKRADGVYLSDKLVRLEKGDTHTLTATIVSEEEQGNVSWASSDETVATVVDGEVTAVASGTAAITAKVGECTATCTIVVEGYLRTWYTSAASDWNRQALPIGNGNLGGMIFGKTEREQIQVNEITLWSGGPKSSTSYTGGNKAGAYQALAGIQSAMFDQPLGQFITGVDPSALLGNSTGYGAYQNLGDITMDYTGAARAAQPENYLRELDVDDSVVRVSYDNAGVHFTREYFASYPGNVMAFRLTADKENALGFTLAFTPDNSDNSKTFTTKAEGDSIFCQGKVNSSQMAFAVQLKVVAPGADLIPNSDGTITVKNGEEVLILMSAGTNYDITESKNIHNISDFQTADGDYLDNNDPNGDVVAETVKRRVEAAAAKAYGELLQAHMDDYHEIYDRVTLDLGDKDKGDVPTNTLLVNYKTERNAYAENLLFQYGRYLLLASSRDSLPANLQGIWNNKNNPGWASDYHFNVNIQMNYWPAFVTNMAETAQPLVTYLDSLRDPGNVTAREHFGTTHGWVVNTEANIFGKTAPAGGFNWGFTPGSGAWACMNLWDYYEYTQDREVLEQIYPIIKEGAQFWLEYLVEDPRTRVDGVPGTGELVTAPGGSSEHGGVGVGTTYDMSLAYLEMQDAIEAAKLLGRDEEFQAEAQAALDRMKPFQIGDEGQLKEWREETTYGSMPGSEKTHRHLSHLLAFQPGNLITKEGAFSEYYDAAVTALNFRDDGGAGVGWSTAQKASMFARTGNSEKAMHYVNLLFHESIADNLLDIYRHPSWGDIFQVEANMGYTAAVAEMLLQSHQGYIEPLPALPEDWADGSYTGLVARGNFETDATWTNGSLTRFAVYSGSGNECVIRYPGIAKATVTGADAVIVVDMNTIQFATTKGGEYVITNIPEYHPVKSIEVTSPSGVTLLEKEGQTIQLAAAVAPDTATNREVTWKVVKADGTEPTSVTIDQNGLLTATGALARENVRVVATAKDGSRVSGELQIAVVTNRTSGGESENVALNRPVTMTGATIYGRDDLKLTHINDGKMSTRMAIAGDGQANADVVFEFELDGQKEIDRVELYEYLDRSWGANGRIDNLAVQIPDGEGWKTVATTATPDDGAGNGSRQLTLTFDSVVAERVRVIATDNEKECPSIWEVEVYGKDVAVAAADKDALIAKLGEAAALTEVNFTEEDWMIFARAKADAIAVVNDPAVAQEEVDTALAALVEAMTAAFEVTVELDQTSVSLKKAGTVQLTCTVTPESVASNGVTWTSSNTNVATVDENGMVTGVEVGIATITATVNGTKLSVTCGVTVTATGGNSGGSTGGGSSTPTDTTKTETRDDGSKVTTVTKPDGSKTVIVEQPDGTKSETVTTKNGDVTITVTDPEGETIAKVELPATISAPETRFEDVPEGHWADEAIHNAAALKLVEGVGNNKYDMVSPMTRGALATVLHRLSQGKTDYEVTFKDVAEGKYYTEGVAWAAKTGVVKGFSEEIFAPDQIITREQLAVMLARYAKLVGLDTKADAKVLDQFVDGENTGSWAIDGVAWCVENGILKGKGQNDLDPTANVTRAEVAVMLDRFIGLLK